MNDFKLLNPGKDFFGYIAAFWSEIPRGSKNIFYMVMILNIAAFGFFASNIALNHDGLRLFTLLKEEDAFIPESTIQLGRWFADMLYSGLLFDRCIIWLSVFFAIAIHILAGFSLCRILSVGDNAARFLAIAVFTLFPYISNSFAYSPMLIPHIPGLLLAYYGLELILKGRKIPTVLGILCIVPTIASAQTILAHLATLIILYFVVSLIRREDKETDARDLLLKELPWIVGSMAIASVLYLISVKLSLAITGEELRSYQGADKMLSFSLTKLLNGFGKALDGSVAFFTRADTYFPLGFKLIFLAMVPMALWRLWADRRSLPLFCVSLLFLAGSALTPRLIQIVHPDGWYYENALMAYTVFYSGIFLIAMPTLGALRRSVVQLAGVVLVVGFVIQHNFAAMAMVANYDVLTSWANRILARVEAHPNYARLNPLANKPFVFVTGRRSGVEWFNNNQPFFYSTGIAGGVGGKHMVNLMRALRVRAIMPTEAQRRSGYMYAARHGAWPAEDSVSVLADGTIVVVLDNTGIR